MDGLARWNDDRAVSAQDSRDMEPAQHILSSCHSTHNKAAYTHLSTEVFQKMYSLQRNHYQNIQVNIKLQLLNLNIILFINHKMCNGCYCNYFR